MLGGQVLVKLSLLLLILLSCYLDEVRRKRYLGRCWEFSTSARFLSAFSVTSCFIRNCVSVGVQSTVSEAVYVRAEGQLVCLTSTHFPGALLSLVLTVFWVKAEFTGSINQIQSMMVCSSKIQQWFKAQSQLLSVYKEEVRLNFHSLRSFYDSVPIKAMQIRTLYWDTESAEISAFRWIDR